MVIVICLIFDICDLEFLVTPGDCRKTGTFSANLTDLDCARSCVILSKAMFFGVVGGRMVPRHWSSRLILDGKDDEN